MLCDDVLRSNEMTWQVSSYYLQQYKSLRKNEDEAILKMKKGYTRIECSEVDQEMQTQMSIWLTHFVKNKKTLQKKATKVK